MQRHDHTYRSQAIVVFVKQVDRECLPWKVVASSAHLTWPIGKHSVKKFPTEAEAAEYGFTAAKWIIDNPPSKSGREKEKSATKKKR
jgi:hypothetical protein